MAYRSISPPPNQDFGLNPALRACFRISQPRAFLSLLQVTLLISELSTIFPKQRHFSLRSYVILLNIELCEDVTHNGCVYSPTSCTSTSTIRSINTKIFCRTILHKYKHACKYNKLAPCPKPMWPWRVFSLPSSHTSL